MASVTPLSCILLSSVLIASISACSFVASSTIPLNFSASFAASRIRSLTSRYQKLLHGNLAESEIKNAEKYQKKAFPQGIPEIGADALRFSLVNYTQTSGSDINLDIKTMHGYRKICNKIYQATKYVLGKLGNDFVLRESDVLTGKESLPERWIVTKMNSKSIISDGTPEEARSAMGTLYTAIESGLRLLSPFMPFLTEELWQQLPRRPGDNTSSITIAEYPEYMPSLHDPRSEVAYELLLGCSKGIRSLLASYAVKDNGVAYIAPLNQMT
ncbi:uncharacterized protein DFL_003481 [Arthrobotrys flagrans]|uniref:valine--tRNA ligase n=1 Tax=Arthrobotrys flagrans TaxID=97331 RepID=A0A437A241_ARTFL|nr:hypothetical protein DFL_003481 [Arthrobotrys flagrans]